MRAFPLNEGIFTIDAQHQLTKINHFNQSNAFVIGITPFLVQTHQDLILFDTGLGSKNEQNILNIYQNLYSLNFSIFDITKVVISHLHHDHIKGIAHWNDEHQNFQINFPNAQYFIHKQDFNNTFLKPQLEDEIKNKLLFLANETQALHFFEGESGFISSQIDFLQTNAHSKHHCVFWIKEKNETIFFGGDDAPQLIQMQRKFVTKYDANPPLCAQLREQWWKEGNINKWTFLFYHDTKNFIVST